MSVTGHPVPNVSSEAYCVRRYGTAVDQSTRVDLRSTCRRCGAKHNSCLGSVVEKVCEVEIVPKLAGVLKL